MRPINFEKLHEATHTQISEAYAAALEDLIMRLRRDAESIPAELYTWLYPLLIEAADEIEHLRTVVVTETLPR